MSSEFQKKRKEDKNAKKFRSGVFSNNMAKELIYFFIIWSVLIATLSIFQMYSHISPSPSKYSKNQIPGETKTNTIEKILIPKLAIELPITNTQNYSTHGATWIPTSALPGENGNIIIYAINKKGLFGNIDKLNIGDEIYLVGSDKNIFKYNVSSKLLIENDKISTFISDSTNELTLYTNVGIINSRKFVLKATPSVMGASDEN